MKSMTAPALRATSYAPDPNPGNLSEVPERHHQPDRRKLLLPAEQIIDI